MSVPSVHELSLALSDSFNLSDYGDQQALPDEALHLAQAIGR